MGVFSPLIQGGSFPGFSSFRWLTGLHQCHLPSWELWESSFFYFFFHSLLKFGFWLPEREGEPCTGARGGDPAPSKTQHATHTGPHADTGTNLKHIQIIKYYKIIPKCLFFLSS